MSKRGVRSLTMACVLSLATAGTVHGQRAIRGTVIDSLRSGMPIAGARVALLIARRTATTDSLGRFEFRDVPLADDTIAAWVAWLDSLAVAAPRLPLPANHPSGAGIELALPSRATYQTMNCGGALPEGMGILVGETRRVDEGSVGGVVVAARWSEFILDRRRVADRPMATLDTSDALGRYALCGVPVDATIRLRAYGSHSASGEVEVVMRAHEQRRDLVVDGGTTAVSIRGRVVRVSVDGDTAGVAAADVGVSGDSARRTTTDSLGRFELTVLPRSADLSVRAIGLSPATHTLRAFELAGEPATIVMTAVPPELATVNVRARPGLYEKEREDFEYRRRIGLGEFITEEMLRDIPVVTMNAIRGFIPGAYVGTVGFQKGFFIRRGGGFCRPRFFEDGAPRGQIDPIEQQELFRRAKRVEVYSAVEAPPRFNDFDGCGAVVVWTR